MGDQGGASAGFDELDGEGATVVADAPVVAAEIGEKVFEGFDIKEFDEGIHRGDLEEGVFAFRIGEGGAAELDFRAGAFGGVEFGVEKFPDVVGDAGELGGGFALLDDGEDFAERNGELFSFFGFVIDREFLDGVGDENGFDFVGQVSEDAGLLGDKDRVD